jgi:aspartyl-tRNA(Asn)/glutamyl-tRNA(Gln) amidotransferase subunit A
VPVLIKDNICVQGMPTTCGSKLLRDYRPPYQATAVQKLIEAGAIIFGKANCDEFAMGSSNELSAYGVVRNPWDLNRVPGGSSGGSAAAVAADLVPVSIGSDTGGSVRQPAAFCGIVGLKPTYGRISRYGLVAYGSSLDQIGPMTRSVKDAALLLDVLSGQDERDSTTLKMPATRSLAALQGDLRLDGLRLGVVREFFGEGLQPSSRKALDEAVGLFKSLGATVTEVSLPYLQYSVAAYYLIATAEASANLARFDGVRYGERVTEGASNLAEMYAFTRSQGFGREVKKRIMLGTFALSAGHYDAYYAKANRARAMLKRDMEQAFAKVDLLVSPTAPTTAFEIGTQIEDPLAMYLGDICTIAANLTGNPAVSVPCGVDDQGLPVGLQLMAPAGGEIQLLKGSYVFEQAFGFGSKFKPQSCV